MPGRQVTHASALVAPGLADMEPALHDVHTPGLLPPTVPEYRPAGQLTHVLALVAATREDHMPALHDAHAVEPVSDHCPGRHAAQLSEVEAPTIVEAVPAAQLVHAFAAADPASGKYVPGTHCVQALAPRTLDHDPAVQLVQVEAPALAHSPARHVTHAALDDIAVSDDAVPALHSWHVRLEVAATADEYEPGLHDRQSVPAPAATVVEKVPAGHLRQTADVVAARVDEYRPTSHAMQTSDDVAAGVVDQVPALHVAHVT